MREPISRQATSLSLTGGAEEDVRVKRKLRRLATVRDESMSSLCKPSPRPQPKFVVCCSRIRAAWSVRSRPAHFYLRVFWLLRATKRSTNVNSAHACNERGLIAAGVAARCFAVHAGCLLHAPKLGPSATVRSMLGDARGGY